MPKKQSTPRMTASINWPEMKPEKALSVMRLMSMTFSASVGFKKARSTRLTCSIRRSLRQSAVMAKMQAKTALVALPKTEVATDTALFIATPRPCLKKFTTAVCTPFQSMFMASIQVAISGTLSSNFNSCALMLSTHTGS